MDLQMLGLAFRTQLPVPPPHNNNPAQMKKIQNYLFNTNQVLGRGNFSKVYKALNEVTNEIVAIKVVKMSSMKTPALLDLLYSQIEVLKALKHPNILNCVEVFTSTNNCYIITELCDGDLESRVRSAGYFDEKEAKKIIFDIYQGVKYLADQNIVHRDFKIANIFLKGGVAKIADFGFAKRTSQNFKDINIGSPIYMAPQGLLENIYGPKTDIWGFGVFLYEILHGDTPLGFCKTQADLQFHIVKPFSPDKIKSQISSDLKDLICRCLQIDERKRISARQIQSHPYLQRIIRQLGKDQAPNAFTAGAQVRSPYVQTEGTARGPPLSNRGLTLMPPVEQIFMRGLSPMDPRKHTDPDGHHRGISQDRSHQINMLGFLGVNKHQESGATRDSANNHSHSANSSSSNYLQKRALSPAKKKSSKLISNTVSFHEAVNLLHYCRLLYKTINLLQKQTKLMTNKLIESYTAWLLDLLDEIDSKIPNYVKFEGEKAAVREKKLKEVVAEYYTKYHKELARKPGVQGNLENIQSGSIKFLHYLESQVRVDSENQNLFMLASYVCFCIQVGKLLEKSTVTQEFQSFMRGCNIQSFLNLKKDSFDKTYYGTVNRKLQAFMNQKPRSRIEGI